MVVVSRDAPGRVEAWHGAPREVDPYLSNLVPAGVEVPDPDGRLCPGCGGYAGRRLACGPCLGGDVPEPWPRRGYRSRGTSKFR